MRPEIEDYCQGLSGVLEALPFGTVSRIADLLVGCYLRGDTVFLLGNGGSAATASHFACDLAKGTRTEGLQPFRVVPLTDNVPLLSAWANDTSYDRVFAEQMAGVVKPGDVVVAISASGNSPNVLAAARTARRAGATVVALSGRTGGSLFRLANVTVRVPSDSIEQVEDAHLILAHGLCVALRRRLQAEAGRQPVQPRAGSRRNGHSRRPKGQSSLISAWPMRNRVPAQKQQPGNQPPAQRQSRVQPRSHRPLLARTGPDSLDWTRTVEGRVVGTRPSRARPYQPLDTSAIRGNIL